MGGMVSMGSVPLFEGGLRLKWFALVCVERFAWFADEADGGGRRSERGLGWGVKRYGVLVEVVFLSFLPFFPFFLFFFSLFLFLSYKSVTRYIVHRPRLSG